MSPIKWAAVPVQYEWLKTVSIAVAVLKWWNFGNGAKMVYGNGAKMIHG